MQVVYDSLTGNMKRLAYELAERASVDVLPVTEVPKGRYLLLTYTFGSGEVPQSTQRFLQAHAGGLCGVVSSGSFHWGHRFARAADLISVQYGVPVVAKLNKGGTLEERQAICEWVQARRLQTIQTRHIAYSERLYAQAISQ